MIKLLEQKVLLFGGVEDNLFGKEFHVQINNEIFNFKIKDIRENKFDKVDNKQLIVENNPTFIVDEEKKRYKNKDRLPLYFLIRNKKLLLFAFGEFQPGLYKLYFEEAWQL